MKKKYIFIYKRKLFYILLFLQLETEQKRKTYAKFVHVNNQYKIEEQKRAQNNGGLQRVPRYAAPKQRPIKYV